MTNRALHFMHIPKTGGSALLAALAPVAAELGLVVHVHAYQLSSIPLDDDVFFFLREPVSRFVSSFNSRLRCGRPRYSSEWTPGEATAFARFSSPNALAEALVSDDPLLVAAAREAMGGIRFIQSTYAWWFDSIDALRARRERMVLLGLQSELSGDFEYLKRRLELPASLELPGDDVAAHRTPPGYDTGLSDVGKAAIERWYRADGAFYEAYRELRSAWYGLPS